MKKWCVIGFMTVALSLPICRFSTEVKAEEEEHDCWDDVVDVGKATMRGGVVGATGGPLGSAAGAIYEGTKEVVKQTYEDVQRSREMLKNAPTYTGGREIQPGETVPYISGEAIRQYQEEHRKEIEENYRLSHGEDW